MAFSLFAVMQHTMQVNVLFCFLLLGTNNAPVARSGLFRLVGLVASAFDFGWACTTNMRVSSR
jgi:hypothetical protein